MMHAMRLVALAVAVAVVAGGWFLHQRMRATPSIQWNEDAGTDPL